MRYRSKTEEGSLELQYALAPGDGYVVESLFSRFGPIRLVDLPNIGMPSTNSCLEKLHRNIEAQNRTTSNSQNLIRIWRSSKLIRPASLQLRFIILERANPASKITFGKMGG